MPNGTSLLDPEKFINDELKRERQHEINIAVEVYLSKSCTRLHYQDLMDGLPKYLASKSSLVSWLNDSVRKGTVVREGLITRYKKERPEHFKEGIWQPSNFMLFVDYCKKKLTDKQFTKNKKLSLSYEESFLDFDWKIKASAVMGLKLLEELLHRNALHSNTAKAILDSNLTNRELLKKIGGIAGRAAKNNDLPDALDLKQVCEDAFKKQWHFNLIQNRNMAEQDLLDKYKEDIVYTIGLVGRSTNLLTA